MIRRVLLMAATAALLAGCGPRKYVLLSPEDEYSDDPALSLVVEAVHENGKGRTEVVALVENKGTAPLPIGQAEVVLLDSKEQTMPLLAKPDVVVQPGEETQVLWAFDTTAAAKGSLEMRLNLEGKKIWPIIFSTDKPPDFKAPPPDQPLGGPQGGGPRPF